MGYLATDQSYHTSYTRVNPPPEFSEAVPSLVNTGQSGTWSRRQRRLFGNLTSWSTWMVANGRQTFRVDLTSPRGSNPKLLTASFKRLRRATERKFPHYQIEYFKVETGEGNGVLHMVWAIKWNRPVWIAQTWLSAEWEKITGAHRVWIKRMGHGKGDVRRVSRYFALQYLAGQSSVVRVSWSWWRAKLAIGRAWKEFNAEVRKGSPELRMCGLSPFTEDIPYQRRLEGWNQVLTKGYWTIGGAVIFISGRSIDIGFRDGGVSPNDFQKEASFSMV